MSFEKVYQRRMKENMHWVPETPAKASAIQKTWSDGFSSRSESDNNDLHDFTMLVDHGEIEDMHCDTKIPVEDVTRQVPLNEYNCANLYADQSSLQGFEFGSTPFRAAAPTTIDDNSSPCIDFGIQTPAHKRKKDSKDTNGRPRKKPKKKVYWPKVVGQSKRIKKATVPKPKTPKETVAGKPKRSPKLKKTQKPSNNEEKTSRRSPPIPKQKRSNLRRRATSCKRFLKFGSENSSESTITAIEPVSFLHQLVQQLNQNPSRKSVANEPGYKYNSLQAYQRTFSESSSLIDQNSKLGSNFCKKKRNARRQKRFPLRLDARLNFCIKSTWSIRKKKRTKGCTIRRSEYSLAWASLPICNQTSIRSSCRFEFVPMVVESLPNEPAANEAVPPNHAVPEQVMKVNLDEPVANQAMLEQVKKVNLDEPVANQAMSEQVMKVNLDEPAAKQAMSDQVKQVNLDELIANQTLSEQVKKVNLNEPTASQALSEQVKKVNLDEPAANQIVPLKIKIKLGQPATNQMVTYKPKKPRNVLKVNLDAESVRVWKLLKDGKDDEDMDPEKQKYWERERNLFKGRIETFIFRMHLIQGNRRFSPWKGSVLDSVIGVFLTQNVSDFLSSNAYMTLAARFPVKQITSNSENNENRETPCSQEQESVGSNCVSEEKKESPCSQESIGSVSDEKKETTSVSDEKKKKESSKVRSEDFSDNIHDPLRIIKNNYSKKPDSPGIIFGKIKSATPKKTKSEKEILDEKLDEEKERQYWDELRKMYTKHGPRHSDHTDSVNWEAVMQAGKEAIAEVIESRGQHNIIADRILAVLNQLKEMHGSIDIEWLRYAPPQKVKEYLLKIYGLGLKSVECIRLLALQHVAFPVDVNVARITTRLGWIPLEQLPEGIEFHNLNQYPAMDVIQQYLWPRLCKLNQPTLYQLHYQLITFGKVFCTKTKPNCNACPMKRDCKHFASALASANLTLKAGTASTDKSIVRWTATNFVSEANSEENESFTAEYKVKEVEPIVEHPPSPEPENRESIDEMEDVAPEPENRESMDEMDIEDFGKIMICNVDKKFDDSEQRPSKKKSGDCLNEGDMDKSRALVALSAYQASIPAPKIKNVGRLRTQRLVYELPETCSLLEVEGFEKREKEDPCNYLFAIWTPDEIKNQSEGASNALVTNLDDTVPGTILIPSRTAMKGRFPLNGTYFQTNEVFADDYSSRHPIYVPRKFLWTLERRIVYFGTSTSAMLRGASLIGIHDCFWDGFICVRGIDRKTKAPRTLSERFHISTTNKTGKKKNEKAREE